MPSLAGLDPLSLAGLDPLSLAGLDPLSLVGLDPSSALARGGELPAAGCPKPVAASDASTMGQAIIIPAPGPGAPPAGGAAAMTQR